MKQTDPVFVLQDWIETLNAAVNDSDMSDKEFRRSVRSGLTHFMNDLVLIKAGTTRRHVECDHCGKRRHVNRLSLDQAQRIICKNCDPNGNKGFWLGNESVSMRLGAGVS